jgi:two-component system, NtrC family, sensor kinase
MRLFASLRFIPLTLHAKTIIILSCVLITIFVVIAYISDLATSTLNDQQEREQAEVFAAQVADTVSYHTPQSADEARPDSPDRPDWKEVEIDIRDTMMRSKAQLSQVRVVYGCGAEAWKETVRLPAESESINSVEEREIEHGIKSIQILSTQSQGGFKRLTAVAPIFSRRMREGSERSGAALVVLKFDESQSVAGRLRRLTWPLMGLAILAMMIITWLLFRSLIYEPIDALLARMGKAESGDLAFDAAPPGAPDEIGLLTRRFDQMVGRIRHMTGQLEVERSGLKDRVHEATSELDGRRKQLEETNRRLFELQRQVSQLERLAAAGQLAAQFAHEVGTPLNLISGHVQVLRAHAQDERAIKRLNVVASQIRRITTIVRSMLDSTRWPRLQLESTDLNTLLINVIDAAQPTLSANHVSLKTMLAENLPLIEADPDQLQQVFLNLINNSLDAMPAGGAIMISTMIDQGSIVIELKDTGQGIAPEQIDMIFDPLFTTKQGHGAGLGLTVVHQLIAEHGGTVEVESAPGRGTGFRIKLPAPADNHTTGSPAVLQAPATSGQEKAL